MCVKSQVGCPKMVWLKKYSHADASDSTLRTVLLSGGYIITVRYSTMFPLWTIAITAADAQAIGENPFLQEWHTASMDCFYSQISESGMVHASWNDTSIV
ncbi:protein kinase Xa21 [Perkinsela sp. CCAP 1560/4]|nr:protein kinase Xa21 [Perkinsela sp. CCAP 1560/4]|eukprot:KNH05390.1 protein kinase Xa21 [Perkinsela sp. CCAP 1560/4]